ncbi:MAG: hypothetical protein D6784_09075 [Chloroflexi bacterium]|nr:MAG: hypothetical protein D6784_09075 [Chloroflexota bacterium]
MGYRILVILAVIILLGGCRETSEDIAPLSADAVAPLAGLPAGGAEEPVRQARAVAVVNGRIITESAYRQEVNRRLRAAAALLSDNVDTLPPETVKAVEQQAIDTLIDRLILEEQAAKLGLLPTEAEIDAHLQDSIAQSNGQFDEWLARNQLSVQAYRDILRAQIIAARLHQVAGRLPDLTVEENTGGAVADDLPAEVVHQKFSAWLKELRRSARIELYR